MQSELDRAAGRPRSGALLAAARAAAGTRTKKVGNQTGTDAGHARPRTDGPSRSPDGSLGTRDGTGSQLARYSTFFVAVCLRVYSGLLTRFVFLPTRRDSRVKQRPTPCEAAPDSFDGVLVTRESAEEREARCSPPGL